MSHCQRHASEPAVDRCGKCGWGYCNRCLVYSFGPSKPPFCVGCAMAAAGIRSQRTAAAPPKLDRKTLRLQRKAEKEARKAAARGEEETAAAAAAPTAPEPEPLPAFEMPVVQFAEPTPLAPAAGRLDTVPSRVMRDRTGQKREIPPFGFDLAQPG